MNILAFFKEIIYNRQKYAGKAETAMQEQQNNRPRPVNPRRRKRSKLQIFTEAYLPVVIILLALILIIIFIAGSVSRSKQKKEAEAQASIQASLSEAEDKTRYDAEAKELLAEAEGFANNYYYAAAITVLNGFSGDMSDYPEIFETIVKYEDAQESMVVWNDPSKVVNLSFHLLMADPARSFRHSEYGNAFNKNYVTTDEFARILQQLYDNDYILVSLDDVVIMQANEAGQTTLKVNELLLPAGKKPIMLTETNVNYNIYMVDGDGDKLPDANGAGFASRLVLLQDGSISCEMVDSSGQTVTGAYDMVPILEQFIAEHPDFSYRGARATLALTGYNGLFGYRTYSGAESHFGTDSYNNDVAEATKVASALRELGYEFACYTYNNIGYGKANRGTVSGDVNKWIAEAVPILGEVDTLVFAQQSDIADPGEYSGEKYSVLRSAGFRYYLGFCSDSTTWATFNEDYFRQGRILVSGSNMAYHSDWFTGIFDPSLVLDMAARGTVPS